MITFNVHAFDDFISGTATTWYTPSELNDLLGRGDNLTLHAATTAVSGTGPTLTCQVEHSANGEDWSAAGSPAQINAVSISNDGAYGGSIDGLGGVPLLGFVRIRVTLGGTSPSCRLKLHVAVDESVVRRDSMARAAQIGWPKLETLAGHGCGGKDDRSCDCAGKG